MSDSGAYRRIDASSIHLTDASRAEVARLHRRQAEFKKGR